MAVCSFVGHKNVYDVDIEIRLQSAAEQVVNENEEVTFMLQPSGLGGFFEYCLTAAMRERDRCPEKVKIAIVLGRDQPCPLNTGAFDSVIIPSLPEPKNGSSFVAYERMMKWIVKNSTHIIKYTYEKLHDGTVPPGFACTPNRRAKRSRRTRAAAQPPPQTNGAAARSPRKRANRAQGAGRSGSEQRDRSGKTPPGGRKPATQGGSRRRYHF